MKQTHLNIDMSMFSSKALPVKTLVILYWPTDDKQKSITLAQKSIAKMETFDPLANILDDFARMFNYNEFPGVYVRLSRGITCVMISNKKLTSGVEKIGFDEYNFLKATY